MIAVVATWLLPLLQTAGAMPAPQVPAPPAEQAEPAEEADAVVPEVWGGTMVAGLREVRRRTAGGEHERALALCDGLLAPGPVLRTRRLVELKSDGWSERLIAPVRPLLERLSWNGPPETSRAEVHYARGVVAVDAGDAQVADLGFASALSLAGPGTLRLEAGYDRGALALGVAEVLREQIPEVSGQDAAAPAPVPPAPGAQADPEAPDPLDLAEAAYRRARELLVDRLRADWRDRDLRANLELIQRRLNELEEIRRQREEQEQQQQDQQQDEDQDSEPSDESQDGEDQENREEQEDQEDSQEEPSESEDSDRPPEGGDEEREDEEQQPSESDEESEQEEESPQPGEPDAGQEELLSQEEVLRLLDRLQQIDEAAEELRARLREHRRVPVEKDW